MQGQHTEAAALELRCVTAPCPAHHTSVSGAESRTLRGPSVTHQSCGTRGRASEGMH